MVLRILNMLQDAQCVSLSVDRNGYMSFSYGMLLVLLFRNYRYLQIFEDVSNYFTDICNSFTDILKYLQISINI